MLLVVRCVLHVVFCSLFVDELLGFVVCGCLLVVCLFVVVRRLLYGGRCLMFVVGYWLLVVVFELHVVECGLLVVVFFVVCCLLFVV